MRADAEKGKGGEGREERGGVESRVCMIGGRDTKKKKKKKYYLLSVPLVFLSYFHWLFPNLCALKSVTHTLFRLFSSEKIYY